MPKESVQRLQQRLLEARLDALEERLDEIDRFWKDVKDVVDPAHIAELTRRVREVETRVYAS
jgi:hypothetical protein